MDIIFEKMKQHKKQNLPFVLFRKPNSKTIIGVFQENDHVYFTEDYTEKGFVFAPFENNNSIIFPLDFSKVSFEIFAQKSKKEFILKKEKDNTLNKLSFTDLVSQGIKAINNNKFSKVVLSRTENIPFKKFKVTKAFKRILHLYPETLCYCWFHPKIGLWMGATPEKLVKTKDFNFETVSLAGTQASTHNDVVKWQKKEREEQAFVTQFILNNLNIHTSKIEASSPYTTKTGNLLHLKSDINGTLKSDATLKNVLDILHPTPAVCGLPKNSSKEFITNNEGYDREFYTGFLGELNYDYNHNEVASDIFVNLRCMKIKENEAQLFVGCGITKDSIPENEWEETVHKSKIMKLILKN